MIPYYYSYAYLRSACRARLGEYSVIVISEPTNEQISLDQARLHLRLDSYGSPPEHADDQWILDSIPAAREWCETECGRAFAPQVLELVLPAFPIRRYDYGGDEIRLPMGPILGGISVSYRDSDGVLQVMDPSLYVADVASDIGYIYPLIGSCWPSVGRVPNAVRVRYTAGYTTEDESPNDAPLPRRLRSAMLLVLGHLYENREETTELKLENLPIGAKSLMDGLRLRMGFA
jgi:uncharacterized phiE125 gp8 family phage protein